jgi:hypothetical protein
VVVVGAGGLSAAWSLKHRYGFKDGDVIVVESRGSCRGEDRAEHHLRPGFRGQSSWGGCLWVMPGDQPCFLLGEGRWTWEQSSCTEVAPW